MVDCLTMGCLKTIFGGYMDDKGNDSPRTRTTSMQYVHVRPLVPLHRGQSILQLRQYEMATDQYILADTLIT